MILIINIKINKNKVIIVLQENNRFIIDIEIIIRFLFIKNLFTNVSAKTLSAIIKSRDICILIYEEAARLCAVTNHEFMAYHNVIVHSLRDVKRDSTKNSLFVESVLDSRSHLHSSAG